MKAKDLRELSEEELLGKLQELSAQLNGFSKLTPEKIEKPRQKSILRHDRARILTILNEKKVKN